MGTTAIARQAEFTDAMKDNFLQNQKAGTKMYKVVMLPLAEEDIMNNTDYIAFEKT